MTDERTATTALGRLTRGFNRVHRQSPSSDAVARCDFCSKPITSGDRVTTYLSEADLGGYARPLPGTTIFAHRTYCGSCDRQHIIYPHRGTIEFLFAATYHSDGTQTDWTVRDSSPADHGEPWDGEAVSSLLYGDLFEQLSASMALAQLTIGHEDIVDHIRLTGINLREIFDEHGTLIAPTAKRERLQDRVRTRMRELVEHTDDEFHDHLEQDGYPGAFTCPECGTQAMYWACIKHAETCSSARDGT